MALCKHYECTDGRRLNRIEFSYRACLPYLWSKLLHSYIILIWYVIYVDAHTLTERHTIIEKTWELGEQRG